MSVAEATVCGFVTAARAKAVCLSVRLWIYLSLRYLPIFSLSPGEDLLGHWEGECWILPTKH